MRPEVGDERRVRLGSEKEKKGSKTMEGGSVCATVVDGGKEKKK